VVVVEMGQKRHLDTLVESQEEVADMEEVDKEALDMCEMEVVAEVEIVIEIAVEVVLVIGIAVANWNELPHLQDREVAAKTDRPE
jgi:hypothetical protein